jgi:hypothetical protein
MSNEKKGGKEETVKSKQDLEKKAQVEGMFVTFFFLKKLLY